MRTRNHSEAHQIKFLWRANLSPRPLSRFYYQEWSYVQFRYNKAYLTVRKNRLVYLWRSKTVVKGCSRFEFHLGFRLFWLTCFTVFLIPTRRKPVQYPQTHYDRLLSLIYRSRQFSNFIRDYITIAFQTPSLHTLRPITSIRLRPHGTSTHEITKSDMSKTGCVRYLWFNYIVQC